MFLKIIFLILPILFVQCSGNHCKSSTSAIIYRIDYIPGTKGIGFRQLIHYVYTDSGKKKTEYYKLKHGERKQVVGNSILICLPHSTKFHPKITEWHNEFQKSDSIKYFHTNKNGYSEIVLCNQLVIFRMVSNAGTKESFARSKMEDEEKLKFIYFDESCPFPTSFLIQKQYDSSLILTDERNGIEYRSLP